MLTTNVKNKILILVESPAKCKKIEQYLGIEYKCLATYGHLRCLPSLKNIDVNNNFLPTYRIVDEEVKRKNIILLKSEIKKAVDVILATDNDREGEAIAWHLCELFDLNVATTKRILFNEITESALKEAVSNPTTINMSIVNAQQARQILDVLVGFKISPILWKLIKNGKENALSAGRCQTPALKLVYENQQEINTANERKIYKTIGYFTNLNLPFQLNKDFEDEDEMIDFLDKSVEFRYNSSCSQPVKKYEGPPEPFTTSRIQQIASNELHYSPKETMRICQQLYENGFITYMRTDSKTYSEEFLLQASNYISSLYGTEYCNNNDIKVVDIKRSKKEKKTNAQEAHEAIRPTNISLQTLPEEVDIKEKKLYKLIWTNTLESCMSPASIYSITASISAPKNTKYTYISDIIDFPGWKIVSNKFSRENSSVFVYLQNIKQETMLCYKKIVSTVSMTGTKTHYTEARLVQLLEEKGIGRPSTFSSLIDKIQERGYVKKQSIKGKEIICRDFELEDGDISEIKVKREFGNEKNKLVIQPMGVIVMEFLDKHFNSLFQYEYTNIMENELDEIAKGNVVWHTICEKCNQEIDELINICNEPKFEVQIDDKHTFLIGKHGPVVKCIENETITFKQVKPDLDISLLRTKQIKLEDIIDTNKTSNLGMYREKEVIVKKGKFGLYVMWGEITKSLKEFGNRPIENITYDEVVKILEKELSNNTENVSSKIIRTITTNLSIRVGPKGDYLYFKTPKMKRPLFYDIKEFNDDYKTCNIDVLKTWIKERYKIF